MTSHSRFVRKKKKEETVNYKLHWNVAAVPRQEPVKKSDYGSGIFTEGIS